MISENTVAETWQGMSKLTEADAPLLVDQMREEQPVIMTYLLAASDASFDLDDGQVVFFIGIVVWQIMRKGQLCPHTVSEQLLEQIIDANEAQLEKLADDPEADLLMASHATTDGYPEPEVLRYIVEALMEPDEEVEFSEENMGLAFIILKNILDALIASRTAR